jgi:hypothetical protein
MKLLAHILCVACFLTGSAAHAGEQAEYTPVASYINKPEIRDKDGTRASAILREHKINCVVTASFGATLSVPTNQADEARRLLAKAMKAEGLRITLTVRKGDRFVDVTPESVLEPTKER